MIHVESADAACSACGEKPKRGTVTVTIGAMTIVLCKECGDHTATTIQDKLSQLGWISLPSDATTSKLVTSFAVCPLDLFLDELVISTVRYNVGPLDADMRRIATAVLERLDALGIARKKHRAGCEIWPKYRLCNCSWEVPS